MPFQQKRRKYASKRRPGTTRRRRVTKPSKKLVKQVQSIIHKNVETKQAFLQQVTTTYNSGIDTSADIKFIVPSIDQGVNESQRIGDHLRAQKLKLSGILTMNLTYGASTSATRLGVRVFIVQPKLFTNQPSILANAADWLPYLLRKGNVSVPFSGLIQDLHAPVNTDMITCYYDKIFYMTIPYMLTNVGQSETRFSTKFFTKEFKLRNKKLSYNTGYASNQQPTNWSPVILLGYVHLDGSAADTVNQQVAMSWDSLITYEDA